MTDQTTDTSTIPTPAPRKRRRLPRSTPLLALGVVALFVVAIWVAANRASNDTDDGLVFIIPAGASESVAVPGIDSAIEIPTDIQFGPGDVAKITVINEDSVVNRAGPWVIEPGQTYTARFDEPGLYQFDCAVDATESVTVTVTDEEV
jgi:plastocyanin